MIQVPDFFWAFAKQAKDFISRHRINGANIPNPSGQTNCVNTIEEGRLAELEKKVEQLLGKKDKD